MNVYFLKDDGHYVDKRDSANYIRIVTEPDSGSKLYNVAEYYLDSKKKSVGRSSKIDPPEYEGTRIEYFKNGKKEQIANYSNGTKVDDEFDFYPNGKLYLSLKRKAVTSVEDNSVNEYLIMANFDSTGVASVVDGNGPFKIYDDHFKTVIESGTVKNGKRDGICTGSKNNGKWQYKEQYQEGNLLSGSMTDDKGQTTTYQSRMTMPQYKGGLKAFYRYLGAKIIYPSDEREKNIQGTVVIGFVVEKDGKLSDFKILNSVSSGLDNEALRVMRNSSLWIPATEFGRNVRVYYQIPISFSLTEN